MPLSQAVTATAAAAGGVLLRSVHAAASSSAVENLVLALAPVTLVVYATALHSVRDALHSVLSDATVAGGRPELPGLEQLSLSRARHIRESALGSSADANNLALEGRPVWSLWWHASFLYPLLSAVLVVLVLLCRREQSNDKASQETMAVLSWLGLPPVPWSKARRFIRLSAAFLVVGSTLSVGLGGLFDLTAAVRREIHGGPSTYAAGVDVPLINRTHVDVWAWNATQSEPERPTGRVARRPADSRVPPLSMCPLSLRLSSQRNEHQIMSAAVSADEPRVDIVCHRRAVDDLFLAPTSGHGWRTLIDQVRLESWLALPPQPTEGKRAYLPKSTLPAGVRLTLYHMEAVCTDELSISGPIDVTVTLTPQNNRQLVLGSSLLKENSWSTVVLVNPHVSSAQDRNPQLIPDTTLPPSIKCYFDCAFIGFYSSSGEHTDVSEGQASPSPVSYANLTQQDLAQGLACSDASVVKSSVDFANDTAHIPLGVHRVLHYCGNHTSGALSRIMFVREGPPSLVEIGDVVALTDRAARVSVLFSSPVRIVRNLLSSSTVPAMWRAGGPFEARLVQESDTSAYTHVAAFGPAGNEAAGRSGPSAAWTLSLQSPEGHLDFSGGDSATLRLSLAGRPGDSVGPSCWDSLPPHGACTGWPSAAVPLVPVAPPPAVIATSVEAHGSPEQHRIRVAVAGPASAALLDPSILSVRVEVEGHASEAVAAAAEGAAWACAGPPVLRVRLDRVRPSAAAPVLPESDTDESENLAEEGEETGDLASATEPAAGGASGGSGPGYVSELLVDLDGAAAAPRGRRLIVAVALRDEYSGSCYLLHRAVAEVESEEPAGERLPGSMAGLNDKSLDASPDSGGSDSSPTPPSHSWWVWLFLAAAFLAALAAVATGQSSKLF
ncbi:hypothetical protein HK405_014161 [Cladochytrium tenue]|nr:hypothetical protein HK405_014161 [Cladochytrium tenue]